MQTDTEKTEERDLAISKMKLRKNSQAILKNLQQEIVISKGVSGSKSITPMLKPVPGNMKKVNIHKPDAYGFYTDDKGRRVCDIDKLRDQNALDEHHNNVGIRFDQCGFPKNQKDRDFILNHDFTDLSRFIPSNEMKWLFFHGSVGRGKTSLAIRAAWELIKDRYSKKVTFLSVGGWVQSQMPNNVDLTMEDVRIRERYKSINGSNTEEIVVLDDFDKFKIKSEFQANILFNLIDELKNRDCIVIITSNSSIDEMSENCHEKLLPVLDRIRGKSIIFPFDGMSFR